MPLLGVNVVGEDVPLLLQLVGVLGCPVFHLIITETILLPSGVVILTPDVLAV